MSISECNENSTKGHYVLLDLLLLSFWFLFSGIIISLFIMDGLTIYSTIAGLVSTAIVSSISHKFILHGNEAYKKSIKTIMFNLRDFLILFFDVVYNLIIANAMLIYQTITKKIEPKIVSIPVDLRSKAEVTLLSSVITMTPGTMVMNLDEIETGYILKIHFSYLRSEDMEENIERTIKRWESLIRGMFT